MCIPLIGTSKILALMDQNYSISRKREQNFSVCFSIVGQFQTLKESFSSISLVKVGPKAAALGCVVIPLF